MAVDKNKNDKKENQHIPRYIKNKPWYYDSDNKEDDYLSHHRQTHGGNNLLDIENNSEAKHGAGIHDTFKRNNISQNNTNKGKRPTCTNCGGFDHTKKGCMERPRKTQKQPIHGVKATNNSKIIDEQEMDWDARKDRWFGYSGKEYDETLAKWEENKNITGNHKNDTNSHDYDIDEEIELMKLKLGNYKTNKEDQHNEDGITAIRIREDKAAYLNDINSTNVNYDPKSRLYKDETLGSIDEKSNMFRRHLTGEGLEFEEMNKMARSNARKEGIRDEVKDEKKIEHVLIANPTKYEQMKRQEQSRKSSATDIEMKGPKKILGEAKKVKGKKQDKESLAKLRNMYK